MTSNTFFGGCIFLLIGFVMQHAFCLSPEHNLPRIGDELTILELTDVAAVRMSNEEIVDLSTAQVSGESAFKAFAPAKEDSLTSIILKVDKKIHKFVCSGNCLYETKTYRPGETRIYNPSIPYLTLSDSLYEIALASSGRLAGIGPYTSKGHRVSNIKYDTKLITLQGDTICNVDCIQYKTEEKFFYVGVDTVRHIGFKQQWYARGYRYPALTYTDNLMVTLNGDTVDRVCRWEAIDLKEQEEKIKGDDVNEYLRRIFDKPDYTTKYMTKPSDCHNGFNSKGNVNWDEQKKKITVHPDMKARDFKPVYVLCDAMGRVFSYGELNTTETFEMTLNDYPDGVYIFALNIGDDLLTYKISVR
ncbi:MAG: hypothetical protein K2M55_02615 [Muribaculaceae bacterium]|nr:hypothetical protein [Muribaculaceae bacterium]